MPKKKPNASESERGKGKSEETPSVGHSRRKKDARAGVQRAGKSARGVGPPCEKCGQVHQRCSAHNRRGGPCGQQPLRFQQVCRSHGGNTKLSRKAAQERMMELVWPALARLDNLVNDPNTDPAIVVKVVSQILDRAHGAGLSRHASMDVGFAEDTAYGRMISEGNPFVVLRGEENIIDPADERPTLASGGEEDPLDDALDAALARRERDREREASRRISNHGHDVVRGDVVEDPSADIFGYPKSRAQKLAESGRRTEHDPTPPRNPDEKPFAAYERRVREGVENH